MKGSNVACSLQPALLMPGASIGSDAAPETENAEIIAVARAVAKNPEGLRLCMKEK